MTISPFLLLTITLNSLLGLAVFLHDKKSKKHQFFSLFVLFVNLWMLSNYLENEISIVGEEHLSLFLRFDFFFAALVFYCWFRFCFEFTQTKLSNRGFFHFFNAIVPVWTFVAAFLSFTPYILKNINFDGSVIQFDDGVLWPLYSWLLLFLGAGGLVVLYSGRKKAQKDSLVRKQINLIFSGFLISVGNAVIINLILQPFFDISLELSRIGLYGLVVLVAFTAYAILKLKMLEIKVIATESLVILLTLLLLFEGLLSGSVTQLLYKTGFAVLVGIFGVLIVKSVYREIDERKQIATLAKSLEKANLRLQELDRQKTEFLSIASHQLRTPLSIMKGYIELIQDGAYGKITKKTNGILNDMDTSNEHLVKLVDEFLDISRIEQGRTKYHFEMESLSGLVDATVKELVDRAKEKGLKISWKKPKTAPDVFMDSEKVRHVIFNFIDNAIKYSNKGTIHVSFESKNDQAIVRVKDAGIGFGKEDEANFYQKFYRGKNVEGINVNGTGLGLYVCRKFIEHHKGEVWATSEGSGKGSEFGFSVPTQDVGQEKIDVEDAQNDMSPAKVQIEPQLEDLIEQK